MRRLGHLDLVVIPTDDVAVTRQLNVDGARSEPMAEVVKRQLRSEPGSEKSAEGAEDGAKGTLQLPAAVERAFSMYERDWTVVKHHHAGYSKHSRCRYVWVNAG